MSLACLHSGTNKSIFLYYFLLASLRLLKVKDWEFVAQIVGNLRIVVATGQNLYLVPVAYTCKLIGTIVASFICTSGIFLPFFL